MKTITLLLVVFFCITSCNQPVSNKNGLGSESVNTDSLGIVEILSNLDCAGSGYCYLYNSNSILSEYNNHHRLYIMLDSAYKQKSSKDLRMVYNLRYLIENHNRLTESYLDSFKLTKPVFEKVAYIATPTMTTKMAVKPPNPCPIGTSCIYSSTSISYYTVNKNDSCNVYKNKSKINVDTTYYNSQTSIKTFIYEKPITGNHGDKIEVHYSVTYPGANENVSETGIYTETVQ